MPTWNAILEEIIKEQAVNEFALDAIRRKYLLSLSQVTNRNTIAYYSGFLERDAGTRSLYVDDTDINHFMRVIQGLDRTKGLDLILHTSGGDVAAAEAIVTYLKAMFGNDIRVIVPQIAMSAGTMIACSSKEILMGKHSSLGPIDPQLGGMPAQGILKEFKRAKDEMDAHPNSPGTFATWQTIINKYQPTLLIACEQSIEWAEKMVEAWLKQNMFGGDPDADSKAEAIVRELGDHQSMKAHNRHISVDKCIALGIKAKQLEDDQQLQEAVLSVHHAYMHTFSSTNAAKIVENQNGLATIISTVR